MAKNKRQPYAVSEKAGEQTSAESWGTGAKREMPLIWLANIDVLRRSRCRSYPSCLWWWYASCWASSFWQSVSIWSYVRTHKSMAEMAPEDQSWTKVRISDPGHFSHADNCPGASLLHLPSLPLLFLLSYSPVATASPTYLKSLL